MEALPYARIRRAGIVPGTLSVNLPNSQGEAYQLQRSVWVKRLAAPKSIKNAHRLTSRAFSTTAARSAERQPVYDCPSRPSLWSACKRYQRRRMRNRNSQEAQLCPRLRYRVPSFCPVPGESRRCRPTTGRSRHIFASTEIVTSALRIVPHLRPDNSVERVCFKRASPDTPPTDLRISSRISLFRYSRG